MTIVRLRKIGALCLFMSILGCLPASSRVWKPSPEKLAQDYALISDTRGDEFVVLQWVAPTLISQSKPGAAAITQMLRDYVVVLAVHARMDKSTLSFSFYELPTPQATDQQNKALAFVPRETLPPTMNGALTAIESSFRQSIGKLGQGMKLFAFNSQGLDACKNGRLSVLVAGEVYTWDTPFAGLPESVITIVSTGAVTVVRRPCVPPRVA